LLSKKYRGLRIWINTASSAAYIGVLLSHLDFTTVQRITQAPYCCRRIELRELLVYRNSHILAVVCDWLLTRQFHHGPEGVSLSIKEAEDTTAIRTAVPP
jgi:hypothetical protein